MIYVGIDVAKHKHDCFIVDSNGVVLHDVFTIENSLAGFNHLVQKIAKLPCEIIRIGLESTGHYSKNLINFLSNRGFDLVVLNPLSTNLYRKAQSLRKTKTDKVDARTIAKMLFMNNTQSYSPPSYHIEELKSLTRHRRRLVKMRSTYKVHFARLMDIVFPELPKLFSSINKSSIYTLLLEYSTPKEISSCHLTKLSNLLIKCSKGKFTKDTAIAIKQLACSSIGSNNFATSFELKQVIRLIQTLTNEISLLDSEIKERLVKMNSPITSIPGISFTLGASIISEIDDINLFSSPAKLLAFAGLEPSTYQSGNFNASNTHMVKRGSKYLRTSLFHAAQYIVRFDPQFKLYYQKKRAEGKHHNVALSHVARKLIRVIFRLLKNNEQFVSQIA